MKIEKKLKDMIARSVGLDNVEGIQLNDSMIKDLGVDSIDFLEIFFMIEKELGVTIKTDNLNIGGLNFSNEDSFENGGLTEEATQVLRKFFNDRADQFTVGMNRYDLAAIMTVADLADIVLFKLVEKNILSDQKKKVSLEDFIVDNELNGEGAAILKEKLPEHSGKFEQGMPKEELFGVFKNDIRQYLYTFLGLEH